LLGFARVVWLEDLLPLFFLLYVFLHFLLSFSLVIQIGLLRSYASPLALSFRLLGLRNICSAAAYGKAVRHSVWRRFGGQEPGGGVGRVTTEQGGRSANGALLLDFVRSEMETGKTTLETFWIVGTAGCRATRIRGLGRWAVLVFFH